jgi:hypothetical protein
MTKPLPILQEPLRKKYSICPGDILCPKCPIFAKNGGLCSGCTNHYRERCLQRHCYSRCNLCGGGRHSIVPATCGRSPLRNHWAKIILRSLRPYRPEKVDIETPLIPIIYGQDDARNIPQMFPFIDAWAIPVHKAMNIKGRFRSEDMKDYLGLSCKQKLILSTAGPDDFMEMLWEKGEKLNYGKHGFNYWFPAHFSVYDNDSKFYQFFNYKRQQIHARKIKSQFLWFRLGEHISISCFEPIPDSPSILISCQQMYSHFNRGLLKKEIEIADNCFPSSSTFFLLGSGYGANIKGYRKVHELHSRWIVQGLKGRDFKNISHRRLDRRHLLYLNLNNLYCAVSKRRRTVSI